MHELVHRDGDVSSQPNRVRATTIVEPMMEPEGEEIAYVCGVEVEVIEQDAVGHAQTHGGIISPDSDHAVPSVLDVLKPILDDSQPFFPEVLELSRSSKCVTDGHSQHSRYSLGLPQGQSQDGWRKAALLLHGLEDGSKPESVLVVFRGQAYVLTEDS